MALDTNALTDFKGETLRGSPGYFRVGQTHAGQWWLIDPENRPFFAKAVHGVAADAEATDDPAARLRMWGFNTVGCGSERLAMDEGLPFLATVDFCAAGTPLQLGGVRLPDVFDSDWPRQARERAVAVCEPLIGNRELLGWITDDRPAWPTRPDERRPGLLQVCLSLEPGLAAYHAAWEFALALHGGKLETMAQDWAVTLTNKESLRAMTRDDRGIATSGYRRDDAQWSREFAKRYFSATADAIRRVDENHLVLGCRWGGPVSVGLRRECAVVADVALVDYDDIGTMGKAPVLLGDFCWAEPRFYEAAASHRPLGPTKVERMLRRGRLGLSQAVAKPTVVGYAWSRWHDRAGETPPFGTGLVRNDESAAVEHTELLTAINDRVEELKALVLVVEEII